MLAPLQSTSTLPIIHPQHGVSFHGLSGHLLQYAGRYRPPCTVLNMLYPTLGLIFVLSFVSIIFIWTEYPYVQSKSALIVITPILLAVVLLVFSAYGRDSGLITHSDGCCQVLTPCPWQTVGIWTNRQTDSPLGGDMDIFCGTIRDRFVPLNPC